MPDARASPVPSPYAAFAAGVVEAFRTCPALRVLLLAEGRKFKLRDTLPPCLPRLFSVSPVYLRLWRCDDTVFCAPKRSEHEGQVASLDHFSILRHARPRARLDRDCPVLPRLYCHCTQLPSQFRPSSLKEALEGSHKNHRWPPAPFSAADVTCPGICELSQAPSTGYL